MKNKQFLEKKSSTEPTEVVTVTLSKNHKTFKTKSGDYRLERYKDNKIRAFKDDEVCSNTKNVLRAINKEYKLGFTSGDFKKMHTRKLGKEIIKQMKDSANELEMSTEPPGEEKEAAHATEVETPTETLFSEEEADEVTEAKVKKEEDEEEQWSGMTDEIEEVAEAKVKKEDDEKDEVEEVVKQSIPKTKVSLLRSMINSAISLLLLFVSWLPLIFVTPLGIEGETTYDWWVVGIIILLGYGFTVMIIESKRPISNIAGAILSFTFIVVPLFVILMWWSFWSGWNIAGASLLVLVSLSLRITYGKDRRNARAEAKRRGISIKALYEEREAAAAAKAEAAAAEAEAVAAKAAAAEAAAEKERAKQRAAAEKERAKQRAAAEKERAKQRAAAEKKIQEARRKLVKEYGEAVVAAFEQSRVCLDMPVVMVTEINGEPDEIKRNVTKRGEKLQYFYASRYHSGAAETNRLGNVVYETRIDFVNGVVTGIKDL